MKNDTRLPNHYAFFLLFCVFWQLIAIVGIRSMKSKTNFYKGYSVVHMDSIPPDDSHLTD